jgi:hypothetical protein
MLPLLKNHTHLLVGALLIGASITQTQAIEYDQNVTTSVIFGDGNDNGSFTVDRSAGVELGLRAKLRFNALGQPENTFNSNGDGTYSFEAGVAPTKSAPTGVWSFEWSINTDFDDNLGLNIDDLTYKLGLDSDPSLATDFFIFDPINDGDYWDHGIGNNLTESGDGVVANDAADYANLIATNNVAQNSWQAHWFFPGYDPTVEGTYDLILYACDAQDNIVASTGIQVIAGDPDDDGDGLPNAIDPCPVSDSSPTVMIGGNDSLVGNIDFGDGCTLSDLINECSIDASNHGQFVNCVTKLIKGLEADGVITKKERQALQSTAAKSKAH